MKVKVKLKRTLYGDEGYKSAGEEMEMEKGHANELAERGVVELLDNKDKETKEKKEVLHKDDKEKKSLNDNPGATITIKDGKKLKDK